MARRTKQVVVEESEQMTAEERHELKKAARDRIIELAEANGGRITSDYPIATTVTGHRDSGELKGKINDGGKALLLHTSAGSIKIEKLEKR